MKAIIKVFADPSEDWVAMRKKVGELLNGMPKYSVRTFKFDLDKIRELQRDGYHQYYRGTHERAEYLKENHNAM